MSRKLGETLVDAGKITEAQLHRALTAQLIFGGHLGTSLLELGYLDEETLGETLSALFGAPYADVDMISRVPYSVVRSLPARLVEKHKVVPLKLEGRILHLAMIDPKNLLALDEISFVTGYRIMPWVSPEVRVLQVLEKYYNMDRTQRFTTLARELSRLRSRREKLRPLAGEEQDLDTDRMATGVASVAGSANAGLRVGNGAASASRAPAEPVIDHWEKYGYGRSWRDVAEAIEGESADVGPEVEEADTRPQPAARPKPAPAPSLAEASRGLAAAESVDGIVSTILGYTGTRIRRSIFFVVRGDRALGWVGRGGGMSESLVKSLSVPLQEPQSVFVLTSDGRSHYLGPLPQLMATGVLYAALAVRAPRTVLVVPILVKGRITGYLYGDGEDQEIRSLDIPDLLTLCGRASLALQILILRNKILSN